MEKKMKKRLFAIILILAVAVSLFAGCDEIIKKNEQRDYAQIAASVHYDTTVNGRQSHQTSQITKGDLATAFNANGYLYVYYYKMTYEEACDYILKSLAQRELLVLFAKAYVINNKVDGLISDKLPEQVAIRDLLTPAEIDKAIKETNKQMKEALDAEIADIIEDEKANRGREEEDKIEDSSNDPVTYRVTFDSNGGSEVSSIKVGKGKRIIEPEAPSKEGYTFVGWFVGDRKWDFKTDVVNERLTLTAKWVKFTQPRAVRAVEEAEEEFDPMAEVTKLTPYFFSDEYLNRDNGYLTFKDEEYWNYLQKGIAQLKKNLSSNYRDYEYYLETQFKTVLLEKLERAIESKAEITEEQINAEYQRLIEQNKESFGRKENYESSLKSALTETLYHSYNQSGERYGFVLNILLKFTDDELKILTDLVDGGNVTTAQIKQKRDEIALSKLIKISNPDYDPEAKCDGHSDEGSGCDHMTCENHACNKTDSNTEADYNKILEFVYDAEKGWHIKYNVSACKTMSYLLTEWPAFSNGSKVGVVNQIKATLDSVKAASSDAENPLSPSQVIYWTREVATSWLYLVGDDSGSTNADSNNNGLGYLVSPKSAGASGFISEFEDRARELIKLGTGSYKINNNIDGMYVIGDNFIDEKSTSNAYAGIFIIVASYVPYDDTLYSGSLNGGILPLDYIVKYGATAKDTKTVRDIIYDKLLSSSKESIYNDEINEFINAYGDSNITKYKKVYESLYKNLK